VISFRLLIYTSMRTLTGLRKLYNQSAKRLGLAKARFTNGVGIKSVRSLVLKKLNECAKLSIKWTKQTQHEDNKSNCSHPLAATNLTNCNSFTCWM